jgi:hypothetical protein
MSINVVNTKPTGGLVTNTKPTIGMVTNVCPKLSMVDGSREEMVFKQLYRGMPIGLLLTLTYPEGLRA